MNGLAEIISINATHAAQQEDLARRKRGLKPKGPLGAALRKSNDYSRPVSRSKSIIP